MTTPPYIPETAPFTSEQRAWLNGFLAGLLAGDSAATSVAHTNGAATKSGESLAILYGSQTGTAEALARRAAKEFAQRGFAPQVMELNEYQRANLTRGGKAIIISSTWGEGDPPDNAANFWSWLQSDSAPRLDSLQFAVLGLGDRNYSEFCGASKKFDTRLESLGAQRIVPRGECDVDYEADAESWLKLLWDKLGAAPASIASNGHSQSNGESHTYSRKNPFPAPLLKNVLLNQPGSAKEVRHFEIGLDGSGLHYEVGDALGVMPSNCPELVDQLLRELKLKGDESVAIDNSDFSIRDALIHHFDITRPSRELLAAVGRAVPGSELQSMLMPDLAADLKNWLFGCDVLDVIKLLPAPLPLQDLIPLLRKLAPRLYSISSSPKVHPGEVHLTISTVRYESLGRVRKGVASTFLADRAGAGRVKVHVQPSPGFKPPADGGVPMIMVGPGTGIAPFRAFLEDRQATGAKGRNWLFFGDQKRSSDFLYEQQLTNWHADGHLARLDLAFSRDQSQKVYVQDRLWENRGEVWSWLEAGAHFYICGDASRMARDVDATLHKIIESAGGKSPEDARSYVAQMISAKRYQKDVY